MEEDNSVKSCTPKEILEIFAKANLSCNLRVLGSQLGLSTSHLDEIQSLPYRQRMIQTLDRVADIRGLSWSLLASVLRKPALKEYAVAYAIERHSSINRSSSSSHSESVLLRSLSTSTPTSSPETSLTSNVDIQEQELTIPNVVNMIAEVSNWQELGIFLGLDVTDIDVISNYYEPKEYHQRLVEKWFSREPERSLETLQKALDEVGARRGSQTSNLSLPSTPASPMDTETDGIHGRSLSMCSPSVVPTSPTGPLGTESQIEELEKHFTDIQIATRKELESKEGAVELVKDQLTLMQSLKKDKASIKAIARRKRPFRNLTEFFIYLNTYCWNFLEYHLLKRLILNTCSEKLKKKVKAYAEEVQIFQRNTTVSEFIKYRRHLAKTKTIPESMKKLKMMHNIDPDSCTLAALERLREEVCDHVRLSYFAFQIYSITPNCIVVEWLIPEEIIEILSLFYSSEVGQELLHNHHVESIFIDDKTLHSWILLATVKSGEYERASSILQGTCTDLDLNCQDYEYSRTALFYVVTNEVLDLVQNLLKQGTDPNIADVDGKSPLMFAAEHGHEMVMLLLQDHGANIDFKQVATGRTALFFAAENGHDAATSILLAYGADPNQNDVNEETPYTIAEKKGYEKVCEELQPPETKKQPEVKSDSFQHRYIAETFQGLSKQFQSFKISLFGQDRVAIVRENQDLIEAAKNGDFKTIEHILQKERDISTSIDARESDKHGWTALMWASDRGNDKIVQLFLNKGANLNKLSKTTEWSPLMIASRKGHLKVVKLLLERGAVIDHQNINGLTSLGISLFEKRTAVAMFLIHKGANIHLAEKTGWNPMIRASAEGNLKLVKIIADLGGYLNSVTMFNWTSVMQAAKFGHDEVVKELAKRGADLTITTKDGDTVLHIATLRRQPGVIKQLAIAEQLDDTRAKVNLNIPNRDGLTALMVATNKGYREEIDALLEGGADVNITHEATRWTAIFFAAKNGSVEIVQNLLHHGAKTELDDGTRLTDVASHLKQMSILHILGTDVDAKPGPQHQQPQPRNIDDTVRTFEAIFSAIEERVMTWTKVA